MEEKIFSLSTPLGGGSLVPTIKEEKKKEKHWTLTKVSYCYLKKIFQLPLPQAMNQELFLCEFFLANYFFDTRHHLWNQWEKQVIIINSLISPNVSRTVLLKGYKCMSGNEKLSVRPHSLADPWSRGGIHSRCDQHWDAAVSVEVN